MRNSVELYKRELQNYRTITAYENYAKGYQRVQQKLFESTCELSCVESRITALLEINRVT